MTDDPGWMDWDDRMAPDLIRLLRIVHNLKPIHCAFLQFSIFQTTVNYRKLKLQKMKPWIDSIYILIL